MQRMMLVHGVQQRYQQNVNKETVAHIQNILIWLAGKKNNQNDHIFMVILTIPKLFASLM
jgi:hypothetical protein